MAHARRNTELPAGFGFGIAHEVRAWECWSLSYQIAVPMMQGMPFISFLRCCSIATCFLEDTSLACLHEVVCVQEDNTGRQPPLLLCRAPATRRSRVSHTPIHEEMNCFLVRTAPSWCVCALHQQMYHVFNAIQLLLLMWFALLEGPCSIDLY